MDYGTNFRAPKVDIHAFSMIPRSDIPRSTFRMQSQHKTTIDASLLYPVYVQEVLPGDTFNVKMTCMSRMATPIYPLMDNMELESWFFFVPCRLVWQHWQNFMGEQPASPSDSISYSIPQVVSPVNGFGYFTIYDYMGLPTQGQTAAGNTISVNALPFRAYNLIWNQWFRDENLDTAAVFGAGGTVYTMDDGPDSNAQYSVLRVRKRHDYFTSCLPWTQKGSTAVSLPLNGSATVRAGNTATPLVTTGSYGVQFYDTSGANIGSNVLMSNAGVLQKSTTAGTPATGFGAFPSNLYADLSTATGATINAIRLAFQTQKLLERDARGGTRYTEIIRSHFGVLSPDARLQRPEYLGGGKTPVNIVPVPQTTATGLTGGSSPMGTLAAVGTAVAHGHGFRQSFTEHGYVLGLVAIRADQSYQQGIRKLWSRSTRYDFYFPVFAMLGEQSVLEKEIYSDGSVSDSLVFGYQERWAEYRYHPSHITGAFRSTYTSPLDAWHLSQKYSAGPALNTTFIQDSTYEILQRVLAAGSAANNEQFLCDFFFDERCARPMPMYSVPGLIDHF